MWEQAGILLSGILHKTPWQGILHAVALQLLGGDLMQGRMTPVALALSDALHHLPPLALTNHMQDSAGKMDHGEEAGIKCGVDIEQRQSSLNHLVAAWALSEAS